MSEYQYYEFLAIDRPLSGADRDALRQLSTRARITATSFTNFYEWGDFKGDPAKLMARFFDLHLYLANWGSRRLMIRLPARLIDRRRLDAFLREADDVTVRTAGENLILNIFGEEVETDGDEDGSGWLAALSPLRADVLSGDLRLFYLLWLRAVEADLLEPDELEPLPGIGPLTGPLTAFAEFFDLDRDLVAAAAERAAEPPLRTPASSAAPQRIAAARSVGELRGRAEEIGRERERVQAQKAAAEQKRREHEAARLRRTRLDGIARRGESVWREIETEIERRNAAGYDKAAGLLLDLQAIAEEEGEAKSFARRLQTIRERHAHKKRFIERVMQIG